MSVIAAARACIVVKVTDEAWNVVTVNDGQYVFAVNYQYGEYACSCREDKCVHVIAVVLAGGADMESHVTEPYADVVEPEPMSSTVGRDDFDDDVVGGLPAWVEVIRPHQVDAVNAVVDAFNGGADVVVLDAPTGSGKTLIAELVRRWLGVRGVYVCSDKHLQDQFMRDFEYAKLLKGRANYPLLNRESDWPRWSAADCEGKDCGLCEPREACPYRRAKVQAVTGRLAVLNTAYLLAAANHAKEFRDSEFVVVDECDTLEDQLMGFVEFAVSDRTLRELDVEAPKKGSHKTTISAWLTGDLVPAVNRKIQTMSTLFPVEDLAKQVTRLEQLRDQARRVAGQIGEGGDADNWIRDNDAGPLVLRPITVGGYGPRMVWKWGKKWLLMSASVISTEEMIASLGMDDLQVETVTVPMTFPVENRQIHVAPIVKMNREAKGSGGWARIGQAVEMIARRHKGQKMLVHCVSYELARYLEAEFRHGQSGGRQRKSFTYTRAGEKSGTVEAWQRSRDGVMFAPSLDRGVDLRDEDCRVQVIAKVPFPYLGDPQVSARLHSGRAGSHWYATKTVRTLVQMTGRSVRSESDWAVTYILDGMFMANVWKDRKMFFPRWWRDAVDLTFNTRALMRGETDG